jgi:hypothetical protein
MLPKPGGSLKKPNSTVTCPSAGVPLSKGMPAALPVEVCSDHAFSPDSFRERAGSDNRRT